MILTRIDLLANSSLPLMNAVAGVWVFAVCDCPGESAATFGEGFIGALITAILAGCLGVFASWLERMTAEAAAAPGGEEPPPDVHLPDSDNGDGATGKSSEDDPADMDFADLDLRDVQLEREIDQYREEWEQLQRQLDPDSPDFDRAREEYDDYIDYLEWQRHEIDMERYEREVEMWREEAQREAEQRWVEQRQDDLRNVMEQIEFTRAARDGYGDAGFDVSEHNRRIEDLARREGELREQLTERGADIEYEARTRDAIGPSDEMIEARHEAELARQFEEKLARREWLRQYEWARQTRDRGYEDFEKYMARGDRWERLERGAEYTLKGADIGVDALATVTGPAGKTVKTAYQGARGVAGGVGEGLAEGGNYVRHISRGAMDGASDIVEGRLKGPTRTIFTTSSEAARSGLDAYLDGEDVGAAATRGAIRGGIRGAGKQLGDKYLPTTDLDVDYSDAPVGSVLDIPEDVGRTVVSNTIRSETTTAATNVARGENVPFTGWNHGMLQEGS